jgi:hypothetical protein
LPKLVRDLTNGRIKDQDRCHLDPDIDVSSLKVRMKNWRGAFGQVGRAQGHLARNGVGPGDLSLFWGLYRAVTLQNLTWIYTGKAVHAIFGWLQVDEICVEPAALWKKYPWLKKQPHLGAGWPSSNTLYLSRENLALPGIRF